MSRDKNNEASTRNLRKDKEVQTKSEKWNLKPKENLKGNTLQQKR